MNYVAPLLLILASHSLVGATVIEITAGSPVSYLDENPADGSADLLLSGLFAGEADNQGVYKAYIFTLEGIAWSFTPIPLPEVPEGTVLESATFSLPIEVLNFGNNPTLGNLVMHHSQSNDAILGTLDLSAFNTVGTLATPSAPLGYTASIDVTEEVRSDYELDTGNPVSGFGLSAPGTVFQDDDFVAGYMIYFDNNVNEAARLTLTFNTIPEQKTILLPLLAMLLVFRQRHFKRERQDA